MVSQQLAADKEVKDKYEVLNVVAFGSPMLNGINREGEVSRLGDTSDVVPYLSGSMFNNTIWAVMGLNRENGGYGTAVVDAHCQSYLRDDVWGAYDVTGVKNGSKTLTLDFGTTSFYHSPVIVTE